LGNCWKFWTWIYFLWSRFVLNRSSFCESLVRIIFSLVLNFSILFPLFALQVHTWVVMLSITLSHDLDWSEHTSKALGKARYYLNRLALIRKFITNKYICLKLDTVFYFPTTYFGVPLLDDAGTQDEKLVSTWICPLQSH